jgi:hypothetical protein
MNADELQACLRMLRAYWPSDWDDARQTVWIDALLELPAREATAAIRELGRSATYPTVAEFLRIAGRTEPGVGETQVVGDAIFLPGSGWLGGKAPDDGKRLALEAPRKPAEALRAIRATREPVEPHRGSRTRRTDR